LLPDDADADDRITHDLAKLAEFVEFVRVLVHKRASAAERTHVPSTETGATIDFNRDDFRSLMVMDVNYVPTVGSGVDLLAHAINMVNSGQPQKRFLTNHLAMAVEWIGGVEKLIGNPIARINRNEVIRFKATLRLIYERIGEHPPDSLDSIPADCTPSAEGAAPLPETHESQFAARLSWSRQDYERIWLISDESRYCVAEMHRCCQEAQNLRLSVGPNSTDGRNSIVDLNEKTRRHGEIIRLKDWLTVLGNQYPFLRFEIRQLRKYLDEALDTIDRLAVSCLPQPARLPASGRGTAGRRKTSKARKRKRDDSSG
jgi:hypothetical protein